MMKRNLIITGDDYGFSAERNKGIEEAFEKGAIKSASLLLNCTGSEAGSKFQNICLGLHLNMTEGLSVGPNQYEILTNQKGEFHGILKDKDLKWIEHSTIIHDEIRTEIQCQINKFEKEVGHKPAYVDGHQHIHVHPEVAEIFASVLNKNGIKVTRFPVEVDIPSKSWIQPGLKPFFKNMMKFAEAARPIFNKYGILYSDCFTGLSTMGSDMTLERLQQNIMSAFQSAEPACQEKGVVTCELMTHPGYPTSHTFGGFNWGTDDFGASDERMHELRLLCSEGMMNFYQEQGIQLVSHNSLT